MLKCLIKNSQFVLGNKVNMWTLCKFFTSRERTSFLPACNDEVMSVYLAGVELKVDGDESLWNHIFLSLSNYPSCQLEGILKKSIRRYKHIFGIYVYFWVKKEYEQGRGKFIISYDICFLLHLSTSLGVMKRIPFALLYTFIIEMPSERWKVLSGVSYDRFGSALETLPRFLLNIHPKRVEERKLYAKIVSTLNLFFFSVHPSSPCVLYWFWYYRYHSSDDDVFSPPSPSLFPFVCFAKQKYFIIKNKIDDGIFLYFCEKRFPHHIRAFLFSAVIVFTVLASRS